MRLLSLLSLFLFAVLAALAQARDTSSLSYHAARSAALAAPALPVERSAIQFRREVDENGSDSVLFDRGLGKAVYPINKALHPGDYKSPYHPGKNVPEEPKGESRQFMAGKKDDYFANWKSPALPGGTRPVAQQGPVRHDPSVLPNFHPQIAKGANKYP